MAAVGGPQVVAIIAVEPQGEPGLVHAQGTFTNGLCAADFAGASDPYRRPITFVTGEATWMRRSNANSVAYLRSLGYNVTHILLEEHGIFGNGHMLMSETNSDEIAALLIAHVNQHIHVTGTN